ncbi:Crp/Fnr family transcriptional regulator [Mesorhizobium australicum]|jgi:CRP-like cAMP-binding protein|uniref:Crp/Fnr family transcriptional regulator n=1 Tax=Mesorhizobium australicum TaxID=536018 RepID=A0ACC6T879_9HYPH|nr:MULTISPECIES: Crp/Fnr family transcriptional regulator [unclassified Mesorhizobium]ESY87380.1 cyclic nucleotide-binding protein [Mesorhizobium sp. LNHC220B00]ESY93632.1 cyclic nucleotide-binding protein [Mesorhizobium sp. LNHC229A00]ESZ00426.1 cyclic nucleotide-binding protein [Mesorhizobium sp. LNHC209A00]
MPQSTLRNHVLKTLTPEDFGLLWPSMHHVELALNARLEVAYQPIEHVYFPETGIASVVAAMTGGRQSEVGIIGRDGMTGLAVVLGQDRSPNETYIQVASNGWCLPVEHLRIAIAESQTLRPSLLRYVHAFLVQSSRTALVNGHSKIEERLARWLLMVNDRAEGDIIYLTHEFLATMLGSRRPGVTTALQMLEYRGLVHAKRGEITIVDRIGMIKLTDGAYGEEEQHQFSIEAG